MKKNTRFALEPTYTPKCIEHFKRTKDDWYGNYPKNLVKLKFHDCINWYKPKEEWIYRVSVWGNDDFGMDKDFTDRWEAKKMFNKLDGMNFINQKDLFELGFNRF